MIASHSNDDTDGLERTFRTVPAGATIFGNPVTPTLTGITPDPDNFNTAADQQPQDSDRQATLTGKVTIDLGLADLVSITGYQTFRYQFREDFDFTQLPLLVIASPFDTCQFTQELRLVSKGSHTFSYLAGLFFQDGSSDRSFTRTGQPSAAADWTADSTSRSYAAFAQATLNITGATPSRRRPPCQSTGCERRLQEQPRFRCSTPQQRDLYCELQRLSRDTAAIWKVAMRQDLTRIVTAYASVSTGYKGPGYDVSTGFTPTRITSPVKSERSIDNEVGLKGRFFDNHVQLNPGAFWTDYTDFQAQSAVQLADGTLSFVLNNVGKLRTKGVEVEGTVKLSDSFRIDASGDYVDARVREFPGAPCYAGQTAAQGCVDLDGAGPSTLTGQNLAGARLADSPVCRFNIGGTYDIALPSLPLDGFVSASIAHQSSDQYDLSQNPALIQPAFEVVNASIGLVGHDKPYHVTLFVNNLFDKSYATSLVVPSGKSPGLVAQIQPRSARRYAGIRLRMDF